MLNQYVQTINMNRFLFATISFALLLCAAPLGARVLDEEDCTAASPTGLLCTCVVTSTTNHAVATITQL